MSNSKHLFIVRHGHAKFTAATDFERKLNKKGREATKKTTQFIQQQCHSCELTPTILISSSSARTSETSEIIKTQFNHLTIEKHLQLYSTSVSTWLAKIEQSSASCIILVGHNPTFSQMVNYFCGENIQMKPAECALMKLEIKPDGIIYPATLIDYQNNE